MSETKGIKVFAGNLSYSTTPESLKQHFLQFGNVLSTVIITRRDKSIGYGFVDFETEEQAKNAVQELNRKPLDSREINVELAKSKEPREPRVPREPREPRGPPRGPPRGEPRGPPRENRGQTGVPRNTARRRNYSTSSNPKENENVENSNEDEGFQKVNRRQNKDRPKTQNNENFTRRQNNRNENNSPAASTSSTEKTAPRPRAEKPKQQQSQQPPKETRQPRQQQQTQPQDKTKVENNADTTASSRSQQKKKKKKSNRPLGDDTTNGLFVANIPYSFNDEQFKKIFEEKGFSVGTESKVIRRKRRDSTLPGLSLGYGFLYVKDKEEQAKVIQQFDNFEISYKAIKKDKQEIEKKRTISVKIAKAKVEEQQPQQ